MVILVLLHVLNGHGANANNIKLSGFFSFNIQKYDYPCFIVNLWSSFKTLHL